MSNATTTVPVTQWDFDQNDSYWPIPSTAKTYYPGQMLGVDPTDGLAYDFDDTKAMRFLGYCSTTPRFVVTTDLPTTALLIRYRRPKFFSMPLVSGTASRLTDIGKPVYAADNAHVQLTPTTYSNLVGWVADVLVSKPEDTVTASGGSVLISTTPPSPVALHALDGILAPTALAADVNNYAPTGFSINTRVLQLNPNGAARNITGLSAPSPAVWQQLIIQNVDQTATENLVLKYESGSSTAANRFRGANAADVTIRAGGAVHLFYDVTNSRWQPLAI